MIESALRARAVLIIGLTLGAAVAIRCQAQTVGDESNRAITAPANGKSANLVSLTNLSRVLKDYVLMPSPSPTPQIMGPVPGADFNTDRVKIRRYLAPWREVYAAIRLGPKYINGVIGGFDEVTYQGNGLGFGLEFTTADKFSWVELRALALGSTATSVR